MVGEPGFEPGTPVLSGQCSNQLSYSPTTIKVYHEIETQRTIAYGESSFSFAKDEPRFSAGIRPVFKNKSKEGTNGSF